MDTLNARHAQRATQRAAAAPSTPYESGGDSYYFSGSVNFASMATATASDVDVAVPAGLTLTEGSVVQVGIDSALHAGIAVTGKVKTGGAFVTLTAVNNSGGTVDPATATYTIKVAK